MNKLMTKEISIIVILLLWFISIIFSLPYVFLTSYSVENFNGTVVTYCYNDRNSLFARTYSSSFISMFVFIPSVILSLVYVTLIRKIKKINKFQLVNSNQQNMCKIKRNSTQTSINCSAKNSVYGSFLFKNRYSGDSKMFWARSLDAKRNKASSNSLTTKHRQTVTICLISLAFFFCQIPIKIFQLFNVFYEFEQVSVENDLFRFKVMNAIFLFTKFLFFLHGMSNPIIYNLMSSKFSRSFRNVILCKSIHSNNKQKYLRQISFSKLNRNKANSLKTENVNDCQKFVNQSMSAHDSYG